MEEDFSPERTEKVGSKNWRPLSQEIKKPQKFRGLVEENVYLLFIFFVDVFKPRFLFSAVNKKPTNIKIKPPLYFI